VPNQAVRHWHAAPARKSAGTIEGNQRGLGPR
jgi:hypothetical protein